MLHSPVGTLDPNMVTVPFIRPELICALYDIAIINKALSLILW